MGMNRPELGFLGFGLTGYIALGCIALVAGISTYAYIQSSRLASCKQEFVAFQERVRVQGEAAEREAIRVNKENDAKKAKYDKQIIKLRRDNAALNKRLLDNSSESSLPGTRTVTGQPDGTACFDRGILDDAIRAFTAGTAAIATEGQSAVDSLDNARQWATDSVK